MLVGIIASTFCIIFFYYVICGFKTIVMSWKLRKYATLKLCEHYREDKREVENEFQNDVGSVGTTAIQEGRG